MKGNFHATFWREVGIGDYLYSPNNLQCSSRLSVALVYTLLVLLMGSFWVFSLLAGVIVVILVLLILNFAVYQFFQEKRGFLFTIRILPWHWLYYLYSGLAFAIGTGQYWLRRIVEIKHHF